MANKTYYTNLRSQDAALFVALFPNQISQLDRQLTVEYIDSVFRSNDGKPLWFAKRTDSKCWAILCRAPEAWAANQEYFPLRLNYQGTIKANIHPLNLDEYVLIKTKDDVDLLEGLMADAVDTGDWKKADFIRLMHKAVETAPHFVCHYGSKYSYSTAGSTYYANAGKRIRPLLKFQSLEGLPQELVDRARQSEEVMVLAYNSLPLNNKPLQYARMFPEKPAATATTLTDGSGNTYVVKDASPAFSRSDASTAPTSDVKPVEPEKEKNEVTLMHDGLPVWLPPGRYFTRVHKDDFELFCYVFRGVGWGFSNTVTPKCLENHRGERDFLWIYFDGTSNISYHCSDKPYESRSASYEFFPFMCNKDGSPNQNVAIAGFHGCSKTYFRLTPEDRKMAQKYVPKLADMSAGAEYFRADSKTSVGFCSEERSYQILGRTKRRFAEVQVRPGPKPEDKPQVASTTSKLPETPAPLSPAEKMPNNSKTIISWETCEAFLPRAATGLRWVNGQVFGLDSLRNAMRSQSGGHKSIIICRDKSGRFFHASTDAIENNYVGSHQRVEWVGGEWVIPIDTKKSLAETMPRGAKCKLSYDCIEAFLPSGVEGLKWINGQKFTYPDLRKTVRDHCNCESIYICRQVDGTFFYDNLLTHKIGEASKLQEYIVSDGQWIGLETPEEPAAQPGVTQTVSMFTADAFPRQCKYLIGPDEIETFLPKGRFEHYWVDGTTFTATSLKRVMVDNNYGRPLYICRNSEGQYFWSEAPDSKHCRDYDLAVFSAGKWVTTASKPVIPWAESMPKYSRYLLVRANVNVFAPHGDIGLRWVDEADFTTDSLYREFDRHRVGSLWIYRDSENAFYYAQSAGEGCKEFGVADFVDGKWTVTPATTAVEPIIHTEGSRFTSLKDMPNGSAVRLFSQGDVTLMVPEGETGIKWNGGMGLNRETLADRCRNLPITLFRSGSGAFTWSERSWYDHNGLKYRLQEDGSRRATMKNYLIDEMREGTYVLVRREDLQWFVPEHDAEHKLCGSGVRVSAEYFSERMDRFGVDQLWVFLNRHGFAVFLKEEELVRNYPKYAIKDGKYVDWKAPGVQTSVDVKVAGTVGPADGGSSLQSSVRFNVSGDSNMALTKEDQQFIAQAVAEAVKAKAEQSSPSVVGSALGTAGRGVLNAAAYMTVQPLKKMANPVWQVVRYGFAVTSLLAAIWGAVYTGAVVYQDGLPIRFGRDEAKPEVPAAVAPVSQESETALSETSPSDSLD